MGIGTSVNDCDQKRLALRPLLGSLSLHDPPELARLVVGYSPSTAAKIR
jgi:hypothetical protein